MDKKQKRDKRRILTGFLLLLLLVVSSPFGEAGTVSAEPQAEVRLLASPASGGRISRKEKDDGTLVVTASANKGYRFRYWKKKGDSEIYTKDASFELKKPYASAAYVAYFGTDPEYCAKSGITDQEYTGEGRLLWIPTYLYDRNVIKELASSRIQQDAQIYQQNRPLAAGKTVVSNIKKTLDTEKQKKEEIYDEQLLSEHELITSHQEVLKTSEIREREQDQKTAEEAVSERFGDRYTAEILRILLTDPPQEWEDGARTCLWARTGAEKGDMVYIICETDLQGSSMIAATVDENNVLRFTVPAVLNDTRLTAVRIRLNGESK